MTATAHALIGGAIAASTSANPALGLTLSAISHPFVDMIPHWDFGIGWKKKSKILLLLQSFGDLVLGIVLAFILFGKGTDPLYLAACILLSESWDILQMPYLLFNWKFPPFSTFYNFGHQTNGKATMIWGIMTQVATVTGLVLVLRVIH
ncbi:hypothetical protein A3D83_01910 [Candidatus Daviesbacteria bacterium RIFCSPHIGHO2_02_FULL_41_10]|uniref:Uncharacterized protein n=2 Tax=Candidatus Daviesiibacteriota TaxID=1752718 RepID=A0A1F5ISL4_9BACT|nr:MAG: hypothetical protein A2871_00610 [Candidatus Daviesbacteria bacterium RIFCSPHIGHO2_01_FULL_41_23]OGE32895.1 MAG: hypothetical protein A3D83_01910 [Candidatus Daviesbacteria bacterium RIFCSPHIGHO2_02_FULL_41_10]OGE62396.1 MAG: hypothetical protein A2967_01100 [Candidatus Daviesbacteria bacterium RIFCSPLOWO2_01_FULL_41_32]